MQKKRDAIIVGIWGVHSGAGVTTLAVSLANYMQGFLNKKTALYEYNQKADFIKIYECFYGDESEISEGKFTLKKVDYFLKGSTDIVKLSQENYDIVIVDFGYSFTAIGEFIRCHYKIVVGSQEPWYCRKYEEFCEKLSDYNESDLWVHILATDEHEIKRIRKAYRVKAIRRPYIDNAYVIDKSLIQFFSYFFE